MRTGIYITFATGLIFQLYYFSQYPEIVANHFGAGGIPNGWMLNAENFLISMAAVLINSSIFLAIPYLLKNTPVRYISAFHKESIGCRLKGKIAVSS